MTDNYKEDPNHYNALFYGCNYKISIIRNLALVLCLLALAFVIWLVICCLRLLPRKCRVCKKNGPGQRAWWFNFQVRVLYELYFEVTLCLMISYALKYEITLSETIVSGVLLALVVLTLLGLTLCCFKGGPFIGGSYGRRSLFRSCWGYRTLSEFYLSEHFRSESVPVFFG